MAQAVVYVTDPSVCALGELCSAPKHVLWRLGTLSMVGVHIMGHLGTLIVVRVHCPLWGHTLCGGCTVHGGMSSATRYRTPWAGQGIQQGIQRVSGPAVIVLWQVLSRASTPQFGRRLSRPLCSDTELLPL